MFTLSCALCALRKLRRPAQPFMFSLCPLRSAFHSNVRIEPRGAAGAAGARGRAARRPTWSGPRT
eukprot:683535-Pyramimonas_sp.AAC.1